MLMVGMLSGFYVMVVIYVVVVLVFVGVIVGVVKIVWFKGSCLCYSVWDWVFLVKSDIEWFFVGYSVFVIGVGCFKLFGSYVLFEWGIGNGELEEDEV